MEAKPFVLPTALLIAVITALVFLASGCTVSETVTSIDDLPNELSNALSSFQEGNASSFLTSQPIGASSSGISENGTSSADQPGYSSNASQPGASSNVSSSSPGNSSPTSSSSQGEWSSASLSDPVGTSSSAVSSATGSSSSWSSSTTSSSSGWSSSATSSSSALSSSSAGTGCQAACVVGQVYMSGDMCSHNGHNWAAKWWVNTLPPGAAWEDRGPCGTVSSSSAASSSSALSSSSATSSSSSALSSSSLDPEPGDCGTAQGTIPANNGCVRYTGRVNMTANSAEFNWPGIVVEARFEGTSLGIELTSVDNAWFDIYIDGTKLPTLPPPSGQSNSYNLGTLRTYASVSNYTIASGLSSGVHTFKMVKRSETNYSPIVLRNLILDGGKKLQPLPPRSARRVEFIGDSYSAGYGVESPSKSNPNIQDASGRNCTDEELNAYTNGIKAYGPLTAALLGAEYQLNAWSGLGMVRNYNGNTYFLTLPGYYDRVLQHSEQPKYNFSQWHPHVVVIFLGTNDFSTPLGWSEVYKSREELHTAYRAAYKEFLARIRTAHPGVKFILAATNLWDSVAGAPNNEMKEQVQQIIAEENAAGHNDMTYKLLENITGYGCGWHPDMATQSGWSNDVANTIRSIMGWN